MPEAFLILLLMPINSLGQGGFRSSRIYILLYGKSKIAQFSYKDGTGFSHTYPKLVNTIITISHESYAGVYCNSHSFKPGVMMWYHRGGMRQITRVVRYP